ncbi:MAG: cardiolipin synthase [Phycisphaeraceae bacterium]|nr:MAG: cardiolipin synthase [Phycisphaeraceae bacterium]
MTEIGWIGIALLALDWLIRIALTARIVMRRSPLSASLAWLVIIMFIPLLGLFLYLLVGENRLGERRRRRHAAVTDILLQQAAHLWRHRHYQWEGGSETLQQIARFGTAVGGSPPLRGNELELISDSDKLITRIAEDIDGARNHCHLVFYIWQDSKGTRPVADALIRAASRGVSCRVLVDSVGSKPFLRGRTVREMREAGVDVIAALPANPLRMLFSRLDLRNHRKIVAIDGHTGYVGSQNLNDSTFKQHPRKPIGQWVDAMARVTGPAAMALDVVFLLDWQLDSKENIQNLADYLPEMELPEDDGSVVQIIPSGPGPIPEAIHQAQLTIIYSAQEELIMTTPYFVPDESTRTALQAAAKRGVSVTLVCPERGDSRLVQAAGRSYYLDLLEAGVKIMHFRDGLLHAKTLTVDRRIALIGSANLDMRSFWLNFEVTMVVYDTDFASILRFLQRHYISRSNAVTLEQWRRRPMYRFAVENTAQLVAPLL